METSVQPCRGPSRTDRNTPSSPPSLFCALLSSPLLSCPALLPSPLVSPIISPFLPSTVLVPLLSHFLLTPALITVSQNTRFMLFFVFKADRNEHSDGHLWLLTQRMGAVFSLWPLWLHLPQPLCRDHPNTAFDECEYTTVVRCVVSLGWWTCGVQS